MDTIYVLKALSDEKRMEIIRLLSNKKYCVRALSRQLNISESAVSQHIQVLKKANLLKIGDKNGYNIHYEVNGAVLKQISEEFSFQKSLGSLLFVLWRLQAALTCNRVL